MTAARAIVLLLVALPVYAEPSKAYLKCQRSLESDAATHIERSNKVRDKFEREFAQRILQSRASAAGSMADLETLQATAKKIRQWRGVEQARETYVEKIIRDVSALVGPDEPGFSCLDRGRLLKVYLNNLKAYEKVLDHVEKDLVQRIDLENLGTGEGLVIIAYDATQPMTYVRLNRRDTLGGNIEFAPLREGQYYRVVRAKAGNYTWDLASRDMGNFRRNYRLSRFDFGFIVEPGKINYGGTFLLDIDSNGYWSATLNDRITIALAMLEARYPELLNRYDIVNGVYPDDRFTEYYLREKQSLGEQAAH